MTAAGISRNGVQCPRTVRLNTDIVRNVSVRRDHSVPMDTNPTLYLADSAETDNLVRYFRLRRFAAEVDEASRRADAALRLEQALRQPVRRSAPNRAA